MESICIRTKLKPGAVNEVRNWFRSLKIKTSEMIETLEKEGVFVEAAFLEKHAEDYYLIYYVKAKSVQQMYTVFNNSTLEIDKYFKECWKQFCEGREVLEELLDIDRIIC